MTEILTESFCERCGTRYTFESAAPRRSRLGRVRTVSKGLKNFVLSDESTFSEAMADARSDLERSATASQLDAFHRTFNFCLTCRQYTCGNCWNAAEGRCLTCMPLPGMEPGDLLAVQPLAFVEPTNGFHDHDDGPDAIGPEAWPEADLGVERLDRVLAAGAIADAVDVDELPAAEDAFDDEPPVAPAEAVMFEPELADEPVAAGSDEADAPVELDEDAVAARIAGVAPGQSVEDAVAAYEAQVAAEEAQREHEVELAAIAAAALAVVDDAPLAAAADAVAEPVAEVPAEAVAAPAAAEPLAEAPAEAVAAPASAEAVDAQVEPVAAEAEAVPAESVEVEPELVTSVAPEPEHDALAAAAALALVAEPEAAPEPEPEAEPEPVAAAPDEDHHGLAAAAALAALAAPDLAAPEVHAPAPEPVELAAAAPREDVVAQPTWPVAPTDLPPAQVPAPIATPIQPAAPAEPVANPWLTVAPDEGNQPQWPAAPIWGQPAAGRRGAPATLAGRPLLPQDDAASIWAASAREVLNGATQAAQPVAAPSLTPQPCVSCGLSLSANARFCRRCGTRQG